METRQTNSFGVQALEEVSQECFLLPLPVDSSIKTLIKIPAFLSLSHPWPCAAFCLLRTVPGYCSAESGSSPGLPGEPGVTKPSCSGSSGTGESPASPRRGWSVPAQGIRHSPAFAAFPSFDLSTVWSGEVYEPRGLGCKRSFIFQAAHKSVLVRIIKSCSG